MSKHFERTYDLDTKGAPLGPLTAAQRGGMTTRLRKDAEKEGISEPLGETEVVGMSGDIGGVMAVTVRAVVGPTEAETDAEVDEAAALADAVDPQG